MLHRTTRASFRARSTQQSNSAALQRARAAADRMSVKKQFRMKGSQPAAEGSLTAAVVRASQRLSPLKAARLNASRLSPLKACMAPSASPEYSEPLLNEYSLTSIVVPRSSGEVIESDATLRVATELGCEVVPRGARISIYWPGSDDWYESIVRAHHVVRDDSGAVLQLKHLCDYQNESGACSHALRLCEYQVLAWPEASPTHDYALRFNTGLSPDAPPPAVGRIELDAAARLAQEELENAQLEQVLSTRIRVRENVGKAKAAAKRKPKGGVLKAIKKAVARKLRGKKRVATLSAEHL